MDIDCSFKILILVRCVGDDPVTTICSGAGKVQCEGQTWSVLASQYSSVSHNGAGKLVILH